MTNEHDPLKTERQLVLDRAWQYRPWMSINNGCRELDAALDALMAAVEMYTQRTHERSEWPAEDWVPVVNEARADVRAAALAYGRAVAIAELEPCVIDGMWTAAENDQVANLVRDRIAELRQEVK